MSEPDQLFNQSLKEKMEGFQPELPEGLWERIEVSYPQIAPKKPNYYKYAAVLLLLFFAVAYYVGIITSIDAVQSSSLGTLPGEIDFPTKIKPKDALVNEDNLSHMTQRIADQGTASDDNLESVQASMIKKAGIFPLDKKKKPIFPNTALNKEEKQAAVSYTTEHKETNAPRLSVIPAKGIHVASLLIDTPEMRLSEPTYFIEKDVASENHGSSNPQIRWFAGVYGGPTVSFRRIASDVHRDVVDHRNEHEQNMITHHAGLELGVIWRKWTLATGLDHFRKGEHYSFQGAVKHSFTNKYTYFSLPVTIGYSLLRYKNWTLTPVTVIAVNRLHKAEASWLNPHNHSEVHMSSEHNNPYRTWGLMTKAQLAVSWSVLPNMELQYRAGYSYFIHSIYQPSMQLTQRPYSWDQAVGVRIYLN